MATRKEIADSQRKKTQELIEEIIVIRNLLFKLDIDSADNDMYFVAILAELGITNSRGEPITYMGYRQMIKRADQKWLREFVESLAHEPIAIRFQG